MNLTTFDAQLLLGLIRSALSITREVTYLHGNYPLIVMMLLSKLLKESICIFASFPITTILRIVVLMSNTRYSLGVLTIIIIM